MIDGRNKLHIPPDEKKFITPKSRQKMFKHIINGYTERFGMKLIYAYLNSDPNLMVDYCVIYTARNEDNSGDLILFDIPPIHSDRSTPGYRYCYRVRKEDEFFQFGVDDMTILAKEKFYVFITMGLGLSRDKNSPDYWKKDENYEDLLQGLLDMSLRYTKRAKI